MISSSRALGDLSENAEYHTAKQMQSQIESKIRYLEGLRRKAKIFDKTFITDHNSIDFGATINLLNITNNSKSIFKIVSEYESDFNNNLISVNSPLGSGALYKKIGDIIEVEIPNAIIEYEVIDIKYFLDWRN